MNTAKRPTSQNNTFTLGKNRLVFAFNTPIKETGYLSETFDTTKKPAYATPWIEALIECNDNEFLFRTVLGNTFGILRSRAATEKLDYIQNIKLNGVDVWCIDDGNTVCLMTKEEY